MRTALTLLLLAVAASAQSRKLTEFGEIINPLGLREMKDYPNLTAAMAARGWNESRIRKVMGENWVRLLVEVWGE